MDIGDVLKAPVLQRYNTAERSIPIREVQLKDAFVKILNIFLCIEA